jgi:hypothetical protein
MKSNPPKRRLEKLWEPAPSAGSGAFLMDGDEEVLTPQAVDDGRVSGAGGVLMNSNESSKTDSPIVSKIMGLEKNKVKRRAALVS